MSSSLVQTPLADVPHAPRGPRRDDIWEVRIEQLTFEGLGQAVVPRRVGPQQELRHYTVFVKGGLPGDHLRVRLEQNRRQRVSATIVEILTPSPHRQTPRCPHFSGHAPGSQSPALKHEARVQGCGGCALQGASYAHQLELKRGLVQRAMRSQGVDPALVGPVLGVEEPWYYRNKMEFSFGDDNLGNFALGLHPGGYRYEILNLRECHLQSPFSSRFVPIARQWFIERGVSVTRNNEGFLRNLVVREGKRTGERLVDLVTSDAPLVEVRLGEQMHQEDARALVQAFGEMLAQTGEVTSVYWTRIVAQAGSRTRLEEELIWGAPVYHEEMWLPGDKRLRFEIHPRAFFQPNPRQAEALYARVLEFCGLMQEGAHTRTALDLYSGTGTIGLCLAPFAERVLGIELVADAVDNARRNAAHNGLENIDFVVGDVGEVLASEEWRGKLGERGAVDVVVVDPPRAGLMPEAMAHLAAIGAPRLVYVSCNPQSLARDLARLRHAGYEVVRMDPVDMFAHTPHVETVALLLRRPEGQEPEGAVFGANDLPKGLGEGDLSLDVGGDEADEGDEPM